MKHAGDTAREVAKKIRNKRFIWCRLHNGFTDKPLWRLIAAELELPLHQIVAFVVRLDELANAAEQRGQLDGFRPDEFGVALGMSTQDAQRIFAALERRGWVDFGAVADFFERNRDEEREDQNLRQQRSRNRKRATELMVRLERTGRLGKTEHLEMVVGLRELDDAQLTALLLELRQLALSPAAPVTSVTSDSVTVTPEQTKDSQARPVDNSGDDVRGAASGLPEEGVAAAESGAQAAAQAWLADDGLRILVEHLREPKPRAELLLERWLNQQLEGDAIAMAAVIRETAALNYVGAVFHNAMTQACARVQRRKLFARETQPPLPLGGGVRVVRSG